MESEVERTLRNLTVVGMLKQHDKLTTCNETFAIHPPTMMRSTYRAWYGEGREGNIQRLHETVHVACSNISNMTPVPSEKLVACATPIDDDVARIQESMRRMRLLDALKSARRGLMNLVDTYSDDTSFQVRLRLLVQKIEDFVTSVGSVRLQLPCAPSLQLRAAPVM